jgi:hypothetical protein
MVDAEDSLKPGAEDDIFDLEEAQEIKNEKSDIEIPGMNFDDEERRDTDAVGAAVVSTDDEDTGDDSAQSRMKTRNIDVPITLEIPKVPGDVRINLNLLLTIKKK